MMLRTLDSHMNNESFYGLVCYVKEIHAPSHQLNIQTNGQIPRASK